MKRWELVIDDDDLVGVPDQTIHVRTQAEAIAVLKSRRFWDAVYFDHDLGHGGDTMEVAHWLREATASGTAPSIERVYVHSMNPVGAENLYEVLRKLYPTQRISLPFGRVAPPL